MAVDTEKSMTVPTFPVIDLGAYVAGEAGAGDTVARELRDALERYGFYALINHGLPAEMIRGIFAEARRFHALPIEDKLSIRFSETYAGYMPSAEFAIKTSTLNDNTKADLNEAFFMEREAPPADALPDEAQSFECPNYWPAGVPEFRKTLLDYWRTVEAFAHSLLPLYAMALDLPSDYFAPAFRWPQASLRLSHYPVIEREANQFGISPHSDAGFLTILPQADVAGLHIRPPGMDWLPAPVVEGGLIINSGDMLKRWSNDRFLSTEHMAVNDADRDRYAAVFFFSPNLDYEMACLPSCTGPDNPPKYPPVTYRAYRRWFMDSNYRSGVDEAVEEAAP